jgi:hypothetical protein
MGAGEFVLFPDNVCEQTSGFLAACRVSLTRKKTRAAPANPGLFHSQP